MKKKNKTKTLYSTRVGDFLIIWITGFVRLCIAEVTNENPLQMKVTESGPFSNLKDGDFIIKAEYTTQFQKDNDAFLKECKKKSWDVFSGLAKIPGVPENSSKLFKISAE